MIYANNNWFASFVLEKPKGSTKYFGKDYPIKRMIYPVDYGYLPGYISEDGDDTDFFKGTGDQHGMFQVWRPDVKGDIETKFFYMLTDKEQAAVVTAFTPVLVGSVKNLNITQLKLEVDKFKSSSNRKEISNTISQVTISKGADANLVALADKDPYVSGFISKRIGTLMTIGKGQGLIDIEDIDGWKKVGAIWIHPNHRGKGLATFAINKAVFPYRSFTFIESHNKPSQKLFASLGYIHTDMRTKEGIRYQLWDRPGKTN